MTRVEAVVLLALLAVVAIFGATYLRVIPRRERLLRAAREIQSLLLSARSSATKQGKQVVVWVDEGGRRILSWTDSNANFIQDSGEPTLLEYRIPSFVKLGPVASAGGIGGPSAVCFDGYGGDRAVAGRIVFRGNGELFAPESPECGPPRVPRRFSSAVPPGSIDCAPNGRCRGILLGETAAARGGAPNVFHIGVEDFGQPGTVTVLKWLSVSQGGNPGEWNYVPPPWRWTD